MQLNTIIFTIWVGLLGVLIVFFTFQQYIQLSFAKLTSQSAPKPSPKLPELFPYKLEQYLNEHPEELPISPILNTVVLQTKNNKSISFGQLCNIYAEFEYFDENEKNRIDENQIIQRLKNLNLKEIFDEKAAPVITKLVINFFDAMVDQFETMETTIQVGSDESINPNFEPRTNKLLTEKFATSVANRMIYNKCRELRTEEECVQRVKTGVITWNEGKNLHSTQYWPVAPPNTDEDTENFKDLIDTFFIPQIVIIANLYRMRTLNIPQ